MSEIANLNAKALRKSGDGDPDTDASALSPLPHNIEAEQQLLGAILASNDVIDRLQDLIEPAHFYDPVHGAIFEVARARILKGQQTDATTLKNFMAEHEGLRALGGAEYLLKLQRQSSL
jgi:replicative DNA helicase